MLNVPKALRLLCGLAVVAASLLFVSQAYAQPDNYPSRPVRLVVGYAPGGPTDILARQVGTELAKVLGQTVVIENKAGANGNIGGSEVVNAKPDGYTLLMGDLTLATNPSLMKNMPFDPLKDLKAVASLAVAPLALVVHPSVTARTLPELLEYARNNPGKLSNGTAGNGNLTHLAGEVLKTTAGVDIQQVPYRGSGPALTDLVSGQISMVITGLSSTVGYIKEARVRPLAITGKKRTPLFPDIPTFSEALGKPMPELELGSWWGLFAPAGTPDAIVQKINAAANAALKNPEFHERLAKMNIMPDTGTPQYMDARLRSEYDAWTKVIRRAGIQAE
ncbi:MAG: tripartite tricarboxylate transporter substrate binding protein [Burkholderiales bacterium]|nr:tripartite tricarboxylate transporter substrate binding protein [Burkholderiales bacterium]ODU67755.1 MAG: hypothetical protein ABT05_03345 [Lautropia sp. SCN 66-9]